MIDEDNRDDVPTDDQLDDMSKAELEALAEKVLTPEYIGREQTTRQNLRKYRDGGIPMQCGGCGHHWVYGTDYPDDKLYVSCPRCYSKTSVKANREDAGEAPAN